MRALILAGGLGTRLHDLYPDQPKTIVPVDNRPFLHFILKHWKGEGVTHFTLSVGHLAKQVKEAIGAEFEGVPISYVTEVTPQGTGGAILMAMAFGLEAPLLILNGDTYFPCSLQELERTPGDFVMALSHVTDTERFGRIELDPDQRIIRLRPHISGPGYINAGTYLVRKLSIFQDGPRPVSLENDMIPKMLAAGVALAGMHSRVPFIDMGTPEGLMLARRLIEGMKI